MAHSGGGGSHGGGSHGGGSHRSGSSGSGVRRSNSYFRGSYYHSYIDRRGKAHVYYSSQKHVTKPDKASLVITGLVLGFFAFFAFFVSVIGYIDRPGMLKDTIPDSVRIYDEQDFFTEAEESALANTLEQYYQQTGVNACVYTVKNSDWNEHYTSLENYSMEKYYELFLDEKHYLVVFSNETLEDGWQDWSFETIVGDDTTSAIGTAKESYMTERIQNNLWTNDNNPGESINRSFEELMEYSSVTHVDWEGIIVAVMIAVTMMIVFSFFVNSYKKEVDEYNYFAEHPEAIKNPEEYHLSCPNCDAPNTKLLDACEYCGTVLRKGVEEAKM